jgi:hypothetical protein
MADQQGAGAAAAGGAQLDPGMQALVGAINALANAQPGAPQRPPPTDTITPWEGAALDYNDKGDKTLFIDSAKPLATKFTGKPSEMANFVEELKARTKRCHWNSNAHGVTSIPQGTAPNVVNLDLFDNWGRITEAAVSAVRTARNAANPVNLRAQQNAAMMYLCIFETLGGSALSAIVNDRADPVPTDDGASLFIRVVHNTFPDLLHQALTARENLLSLHPKKFSYNIKNITGYLRVQFNLIEGSSDHPLSEIDKIFYTKRVLQQIKTPAEFASAMQMQFSKAGDDPTYKASTLMLKAEAKEAEIKSPDPSNWKASDQTPQEQVLAMMTKVVQKPKGNSDNDDNSNTNDNNSSDTARPPFYNSKGKLGDTKEWKNKTWYYCDAPHPKGHWVTHDPAGCRLKAKMEKDDAQSSSSNSQSSSNETESSSNNNKVLVDESKIRQAMAALVEQPPTDAEHATAAFLALLR